MKKTCGCLVLAYAVIGLLSSWESVAQAQERKPNTGSAEADGVRLTCQTGEERLPACTPVRLTLTLGNSSASTIISIGRASLFKRFTFSVIDEDGNPVPLTRFGTNIGRVSGHVGVAVARLSPGEERTETVELNRIFDMTVSGRYAITVTCKAGLEAGESHTVKEVTSNTVSVEIL